MMDQDPDDWEGYVIASAPTRAEAEAIADEYDDGTAQITVEQSRRSGNWLVTVWR